MPQSAAIADAILLFKRNVTLNFEGIEGCAICYSTVSTLDRTLPSKTCKTCSNRFHASCLYKVRSSLSLSFPPTVRASLTLVVPLALAVVHDEPWLDLPAVPAAVLDDDEGVGREEEAVQEKVQQPCYSRLAHSVSGMRLDCLASGARWSSKRRD